MLLDKHIHAIKLAREVLKKGPSALVLNTAAARGGALQQQQQRRFLSPASPHTGIEATPREEGVPFYRPTSERSPTASPSHGPDGNGVASLADWGGALPPPVGPGAGVVLGGAATAVRPAPAPFTHQQQSILQPLQLHQQQQPSQFQHPEMVQHQLQHLELLQHQAHQQQLFMQQQQAGISWLHQRLTDGGQLGSAAAGPMHAQASEPMYARVLSELVPQDRNLLDNALTSLLGFMPWGAGGVPVQGAATPDFQRGLPALDGALAEAATCSGTEDAGAGGEELAGHQREQEQRERDLDMQQLGAELAEGEDTAMQVTVQGGFGLDHTVPSTRDALLHTYSRCIAGGRVQGEAGRGVRGAALHAGEVHRRDRGAADVR